MIYNKKLDHINTLLSQIGCYITIPINKGPIIIKHTFFNPRKIVKPININTNKNITIRQQILENYYKNCRESGIPIFVYDGYCFSCGFDLVNVKNNRMIETTGCPRCHRSFCD